MNNTKFPLILEMKVSDLVNLYISSKNVTLDEALDTVYHSKLYKILEQEETKIWHHSPFLLLNCLNQELKTGKLECPDE
jgi:hypothetical protein